MNIMFSRFSQNFIHIEGFMMKNNPYNEHCYKIKSATFSVSLHVERKSLFGISGNIRHKLGCTTN